MSVHGTKGKFIEYWGRGETGPIAFQKEFDTKIYWPRLKELTKKYNIEYAPGKVVPTDDDELDAIWQAGKELLLDVGILNVSTERRITFTEDELEDALENLPTEVTLGEGKDAVFTGSTGKRAIGAAYMDSTVAEGDKVEVEVRGRRLNAVVSKTHLKNSKIPYAIPVING